MHLRYFEVRSAKVAELKAANKSPYPHKFHVSIGITDFLEKVSRRHDRQDI